MSDLRFDLEDDVSVTELRELDRWQSRLAKAGKLRVQRRGEVVGVLLSPAEWNAVKAQIEDGRDRAIVASRNDGELLSGKKLQIALERELKKARLL